MGAQGFSQTTPAASTSLAPPATTTGPQSQQQNRLGNSGVQQRRQAGGTDGADDTAGVCDPNAIHLASPVPAVGALTYYGARHGDFATRYAACGLTPPTYYLGYGLKYVQRFTTETSPRLTPEGQAWLVRARVNLQVAIEGERARDGEAFDRLEKNDAAFTSFAYGTHADAYWNAGLGDLNLFDLANIGLTPDMKDLLAKDGLLQVVDIGSRLLGTWGTSAIDYVGGEGTTAELVDAAYEGFVVVGDGIDEVFGEGTSQLLMDGASDLGVAAGDLAGDAYDVAADVVNEGVGAVDSVMGEGWTASTANAGLQTASDGADWVEDKYNTATDWAQEVWDGFSF